MRRSAIQYMQSTFPRCQHWALPDVSTVLQKEKIDHIYCSPFLRTVQTAHQVANELSLPVKIEYGLSEGLLKSESHISVS